MLYLIELVISLVFGYGCAQAVAGKHAGDKPERSFIVSLGNYRIHIHHWIWCLALTLLLLAIKVANPWVIGTLLGAAIQGLTYRDRFSIFYKN